MEHLLSFAGVAGAVLCVAMYAAVSVGRIGADTPLFFAVNGLGALLVLSGAAQEFDLGDLGTVGQELTWVALSFIGGARAWAKTGAWERVRARLPQMATPMF